jgi:hypothetical protein
MYMLNNQLELSTHIDECSPRRRVGHQGRGRQDPASSRHGGGGRALPVLLPGHHRAGPPPHQASTMPGTHRPPQRGCWLVGRGPPVPREERGALDPRRSSNGSSPDPCGARRRPWRAARSRGTPVGLGAAAAGSGGAGSGRCAAAVSGDAAAAAGSGVQGMRGEGREAQGLWGEGEIEREELGFEECVFLYRAPDLIWTVRSSNLQLKIIGVCWADVGCWARWALGQLQNDSEFLCHAQKKDARQRFF